MSDSTTDLVSPDLPSIVDDDSAFRHVPWRWRDVAIGLAVPLGLEVVSLSLKPEWMNTSLRVAFAGVAVFLYGWLVGYPIWIARRRLPGFRLRLPSFSRMLQEALFMLPMLLGLWSVVAFVMFLWGLVSSARPANILEGAAENGLTPALCLILVAAFTLVPIGEELFVRGFLYNGFRQHLPWPVALVLQAAVFGLLHPYNMAYVVVTFGMGLYLGLIYEWRRTLLAPIGVHALQNLLASIVAVATILHAVDAPILGVRGEKAPLGCVVREVVSGTAAEDMGLQPGDVIVEMDDQAIAGMETVREVIRKYKVGDRIRVKILRNEETLAREAELRSRPQPAK